MSVSHCSEFSLDDIALAFGFLESISEFQTSVTFLKVNGSISVGIHFLIRKAG